jgi:hypothetical protein
MRITRTVERDGALGPPAVDYLSEIPLQHIFYREQQLRHPASLYSVSLEKLTKAFLDVADGYIRDTARFSLGSDGFDLTVLLQAQEHLLRCVQEHLDDCYLVLKTLVDPASTKARSIAADEYVIASRLPGAKSFTQATVDFKTSLNIATKLKHNQGRLREVGDYRGDGVYLGYYLEEPNKQGALAPSVEIHPNGGAFSFAADLKWRFFLVYSLSENLLKAVERALTGLHGVSLRRASSPQHDAEWNQLTKTIAKLPRAIFQKEMNANVATVQLSADEGELSIKFPDRVRILYPSISGRAVVKHKIDRFSPQCRVPQL